MHYKDYQNRYYMERVYTFDERELVKKHTEKLLKAQAHFRVAFQDDLTVKVMVGCHWGKSVYDTCKSLGYSWTAQY